MKIAKFNKINKTIFELINDDRGGKKEKYEKKDPLTYFFIDNLINELARSEHMVDSDTVHQRIRRISYLHIDVVNSCRNILKKEKDKTVKETKESIEDEIVKTYDSTYLNKSISKKIIKSYIYLYSSLDIIDIPN